MTMTRWTGMRFMMPVTVLALLLSASQALALKVGDKAPDFSLPATTAEAIKLSDYLGKKPLVVFAYLYAFSGG
jgi:peroxiredoxin